MSYEDQGTYVIDPPVVAIDGLSGVGKGTISRHVAEQLDFHYLDSGAVYRVCALACINNSVSFDDIPGIQEVIQSISIKFKFENVDEDIRVFLNGDDVSDRVREGDCSSGSSKLAQYAPIRRNLLAIQQYFRQAPGLVAEGRDMGTVVFPNAEVKCFLTADATKRAQRRHKQLIQQGHDVSLDALVTEMEERDQRDAEREIAPTKPDDEAIIIDTTALTIDEVVEQVLALVTLKIDVTPSESNQ